MHQWSGKAIISARCQMVVTTDASSHGWGGWWRPFSHSGKLQHEARGFWLPSEEGMLSNAREQGSKRVPTGLPGWQKLKNNDSTRHPPTPVPAGTLPDSNIRVATGVGGDGYGRLRRRNERPVGGCGCGRKTGGKQNPRFPVIPRNRQHENTDPLNCGLPGTPPHVDLFIDG